MREIRNICDALLRTQIQEDQCTNFLMWLLKKLPNSFLELFCKSAELDVSDISNQFSFNSQWVLSQSRPDGVIKLGEGKYLVIETKRFPNSFDLVQFQNHMSGSQMAFGTHNCWFLFISGDDKQPVELSSLQMNNKGRIGFLSWKQIIALCHESKNLLVGTPSILLDEFLSFAKYQQLGQLINMNITEANEFLEVYPMVNRRLEAAKEMFQKALDSVVRHVICNSKERVSSNDGKRFDLPCLYRALNVKGMHISVLSSFVFIDIQTRLLGVLINCYQNQKEKERFLSLWHTQFKKLFVSDPNLQTFTWMDRGDDDNNADYFKHIVGTSGKLFNPDALDDFCTYLYCGYSYKWTAETLKEEFFAKVDAESAVLIEKFTATPEKEER